MGEGETDHKGKFWVGQRVKIHDLPNPDDILCDTGIIKKITTKFERTPDLQITDYEVRIDGWKGIYKTKIYERVRLLSSNGDNLEPISP